MHLPCISSASPLHIAYISPISRPYLPTRLEEMLEKADRTMRDALLAAARMEAPHSTPIPTATPNPNPNPTHC